MAIKHFQFIVNIVLNWIALIILGLYGLMSKNIAIWNFFGIIYLVIVFWNSIYLLGNTKRVNYINSAVLKKIYHFYPYWSNIVFTLIFFINFSGYSTFVWLNILMNLVVYIGMIGSFVMVIAINSIFWRNQSEHRNINNTQDLMKDFNLKSIKRSNLVFIIKFGWGIIAGTFCILTLFLARGIFFLLVPGVFIAVAGIFLSLGFINWVLKLNIHIQKSVESVKRIDVVVKVIGFSFSILFLFPMIFFPFMINESQINFTDAFNPLFGGDWEDKFNSTPFSEKSLKSPFTLLGYMLSPGNYDCEVLEDQLYFNGSQSQYSVDKSTRLYFDAYLPLNFGNNLPGKNSTIIRIHGGGWTIGDKGTGNVRMMNRYLASRGYCVFDIQYGLNNQTNILGFSYNPGPHVMGNFTIDDMMRQIGNFTFFLEDNHHKFGANLDSVFISGGSAGGQLTCATALSIHSGNYTDIFSDQLKIQGLIPFYPAHKASYDFALNSKPEWVNPELLVNVDSPPCLIYQGKQDPLIIQSQSFQKVYSNLGRTDCCVLYFPFAGHGSDYYFPGYYNQIFLYYMERFLILFQE